jgi:hypothetical protein
VTNWKVVLATYTRLKTLTLAGQLLATETGTIPLTVELLAGAVIVTVQVRDWAPAEVATMRKPRLTIRLTNRRIVIELFSLGLVRRRLLNTASREFKTTLTAHTTSSKHLPANR